MIKPARHIFEFGPFCLDATNCQLRRDDQIVPLKPKVFDTLLVLVQNNGQVVAKDELMDLIWQGTAVEENNLTQNISALRRSLGRDQNGNHYIETIPKRGYRFLCPVHERWVETEFAVREQIQTHILIEEETVGDQTAEDDQESPEHKYHTQDARPVKRRRRVSWVMWVVGALVVIATITASSFIFRSDPHKDRSALRILSLTSFPGKELGPAFSPDGNFITYAWDGETGDNFDIYVQPTAGGKPVRITDDPALDVCPAWSPDGQYIAFTRCSKGGSGIFLIPALGGPERKLHDLTWEMGWEDAYVHRLSWSKDGKSIAFSNIISIHIPYGIFLLSIDDLSTTRLTTPPPPGYSGDSYPAFSPDGKSLAFTRHSVGASDIYIMPATGGDVKRITFDNSLIVGLDWTPDGREIVFTSTRGGGASLWRVSVFGGTPEPIIMRNGAYYPTISRRGKRLAYSQNLEDTNIWQINMADFKAPTRLIASTKWEAGPGISPDGQKIVFQSDRSGNFEIWICNSDGSAARPVTRFNGPQLGSPKWSPDSQQIAFNASVNGRTHIYVVDISAGVPRQITDGPSEEVVPSWSRDGNWIYFSSTQTEPPEIWKVPAQGGEAMQVTHGGGIAAAESFDGKFLYYAKYDVPGIWRMEMDGIQEERVTDRLKEGYWGYWELLDDSIYFFNPSEGTGEVTTLESIDLRTNRITPLFELRIHPYKWLPGLTLSPDRKTLLYTQLDQSGHDIRMIENFE